MVHVAPISDCETQSASWSACASCLYTGSQSNRSPRRGDTARHRLPHEMEDLIFDVFSYCVLPDFQTCNYPNKLFGNLLLDFFGLEVAPSPGVVSSEEAREWRVLA